MRAGRLNLVLDIEAAEEETRSATGAVSMSWVPFCQLRAMAESQSGREFQNAKALNAETNAVFRARYYPGITPKMRARVGTMLFDITAVINVEMRGREMLLYCVEGKRKGS